MSAATTYRMARGMSEFLRVIPLPLGVDAERASAKYRNGMLKVCSFQDGECEGETNRGSSFVNAAQEIVRAEAELLRETLCFDAS
jgi:hypothetical protein